MDKAKNGNIALAALLFFNAVETEKNQFICGISWLYWYNSTIMSGATIDDGAIIATNSTVVKMLKLNPQAGKARSSSHF